MELNRSLLIADNDEPPEEAARIGVLNRGLLFLSSSVYKHVTVKAAARYAGVSVQHLIKLFSFYLGESPLFWLRRRRLSLASWDLVHTDLPIIEIAMDYGYGSLSAFCHAFSRHYKISPVKFRQRSILPHLMQAPLDEPLMRFQPPEIVDFSGVVLRGRHSLVTMDKDPGETAGEFDFIVDKQKGDQQKEDQQKEKPLYGVFPDRKNYLALGISDSYPFFIGRQRQAAGGDDPYTSVYTSYTSYYIPPGTYAVFSTKADRESVTAAYRHIYGVWVETGEYRLRFAPDFFRISHENGVPESEWQIFIPVCPK